MVTCSKKNENAPAGDAKQAIATTLSTSKRLAQIRFFADALMPDTVATFGIARSTGVQVHLAGQADSTASNWAADYLSHNCVGTAVSSYMVKGVPLEAEIAQFASFEDAFGFFSARRPADYQTGPDPSRYRDGDLIRLMRDAIVVTLKVATPTDSALAAMDMLAGEIRSNLSGKMGLPVFFMLFPAGHKLAAGERYYSYDFMDVPKLGEVFTVDYAPSDDTVTLFLTMDESGAKLIALKELAQAIARVQPVPDGFEYWGDGAFMFDHPTYGKVVAGLVRGKLAGFVGYDTRTSHKMATAWIKGLQ
ncbi:MAG: DUF6599 family protein [Candidatus Zixiibacteriota bacterium]